MPAATPSNEELVRNIISTKDVSTYFQPVVSITTKSIVGFEAFSRGGGGTGVCPIAPHMLFDHDLSPQVQLDIDRLCREKALEQFRRISQSHKGLLLYVNMNPDILAHVDLQEKFLSHQVVGMGIDPTSVVMECPMNKDCLELLAQFRNVYCNLEFKMCLDDCALNSPFSYIASQLRPHFIKINRTFFGNEEHRTNTMLTLESLCRLAGRLGISLIAQGVENEEESLRLLMAGVHLQQGYYYTKDQHDKDGDPARSFLKKIVTTHDRYKKMKRDAAQHKKERFSTIFRDVTHICGRISGIHESQFDDACAKLIHTIENILSIFVLDGDGVQITERAHVPTDRTAVISGSILNTYRGAEHSAQDYVMNLDMGYTRYVTPQFLSPYSGQDACLISTRVFNDEGKRYTVCIEVIYPD